ncbi:MAG: menaquinone biosynthesis protein [Armatimonadetes bacterium]|nr:menaquinone biosynthesis protein [Armatimonadota bacterium]
MAKYRVGCVPFVNARPLVAWFESSEAPDGVEVVYEVPSKLPAMLDSGAVDVVLASSVEALQTPDRTAAEGVCIGSFGAAESVRLFSRVPFNEIRSLALDQSSMTSNALALGLLDEVYGARPASENCPPDQKAMLADHDACLLIGDIGMQASGDGLHVLDLGEAWTSAHGLPFVWALWIGRQDLEPRLAGLLNDALDWGMANMDQVVEDTVGRSGWDHETCRRYLADTMRFQLDEEALKGLQAFAALALRTGLISTQNMPRFVAAAGTTA